MNINLSGLLCFVLNYFRLRNITRKMMAAVSELSMYQASAIKLEQEKEEKETLLDLATQKVQQGLPPTDDAEYEWLRMERDRQRQRDQFFEKTERENLEAALATNITRTTADTRPNAYIPDDVGLPRPYGVSLPFKPSTHGAQMRHFRKPEPKTIEL